MRKNATIWFCSKKFNDLRKNPYFKRKIEGRFFEKNERLLHKRNGRSKIHADFAEKSGKNDENPERRKNKVNKLIRDNITPPPNLRPEGLQAENAPI